MIYIDSDGVLSDFDSWLVQNQCANHNDSAEVYKTIIEHQDGAFIESKPIKENNWIRRKMRREDFRILTSLPDKVEFRKFFNSDIAFLACIDKLKENKYLWFEKIGVPREKVIITGTRKEKFNYCKGPNDVLYDDFPSTIKQWKALGGRGILVRNPRCKAQRERHYKYAINNFSTVIDTIEKGLFRAVAARCFNYLSTTIDYNTCIKIAKAEAEIRLRKEILPYVVYNPYLGKICFTNSTVAKTQVRTADNKMEPLERYLYNVFPLIVRKPQPQKLSHIMSTSDLSCIIATMIPEAEKRCGTKIIYLKDIPREKTA